MEAYHPSSSSSSSSSSVAAANDQKGSLVVKVDAKTEAKLNEQILQGHSQGISALTLLTNGYLASGSSKEIKLWDIKTSQCVATLQGHDDWVSALTALPNGSLVSAANKTIKLWNPITRQCLAMWEKQHTDRISALTTLPDGTFVSGSADGTIKFWSPRATEGQEWINTLQGHTGCVTALATLPDGRLVSGSDDKSIKIWDPITYKCVATLLGHSVHALAVLPDGRLASATSGEIKVWDIKTAQCITTFRTSPLDQFKALTVLANGWLASGTGTASWISQSGGVITLWDLKTNQPMITLLHEAPLQEQKSTKHKAAPQRSNGIQGLMVLPDGRLVSASDNSTIKLWDISARVLQLEAQQAKQKAEAEAKLKAEQEAKAKAECEAKEKAEQEKRVREIQEKLEAQAKQLELQAKLLQQQTKSDSKDQKTDPKPAAAAKLQLFKLERHQKAMKDGEKKIDLSQQRTYDAKHPPTQTRRLDGRRSGDAPANFVTALTLLDNGRLVSGHYNGSMLLWNAETGALVSRVSEGIKDEGVGTSSWRAGCDPITFSQLPDTSLIRWGTYYGCSAALWQITGQDQLTERTSLARGAGLLDHQNAIRSTTVLRDGKVVTGLQDGTIRIWSSANNWQSTRDMGEKHADPDHGVVTYGVYALAEIPNGKLISGGSKTIRRWNIATGQCELTLPCPGGVRALVPVTVNGRPLIASSSGRDICLWDMQKDDKDEMLVATLTDNNTQGNINTLSLLPDGRLVAVSDAGETQFWDLPSRTCVATVDIHDLAIDDVSPEHRAGIKNVGAVAVFGDGQIATGARDGKVRIYDLKNRPLRLDDIRPLLNDLQEQKNHVEELDLQGTEITDQDIPILQKAFTAAPKLRKVNLTGTRLTDDGLQQLYKSLKSKPLLLEHPRMDLIIALIAAQEEKAAEAARLQKELIELRAQIQLNEAKNPKPTPTPTPVKVDVPVQPVVPVKADTPPVRPSSPTSTVDAPAVPQPSPTPPPFIINFSPIINNNAAISPPSSTVVSPASGSAASSSAHAATKQETAGADGLPAVHKNPLGAGAQPTLAAAAQARDLSASGHVAAAANAAVGLEALTNKDSSTNTNGNATTTLGNINATGGSTVIVNTPPPQPPPPKGLCPGCLIM